MGVDELAIPEQSLDAVLGMSILHLLENKEETITKVFKMLKPGGVFVTSTACIGDSMRFFKAVAPIGRFLGLMPLVKVFESPPQAVTLRQRATAIRQSDFITVVNRRKADRSNLLSAVAQAHAHAHAVSPPKR